MTDNLGYGLERRRQGNRDILTGRATFRDAFREMLESVNEKHTFEECRQVVTKNIPLDPGFKEFSVWAEANDIPVVIVSSGMEPIIRSILDNLLGVEVSAKMDIVSNHVDIKPDGHFSIVYRHPESPFGHDKSKALRPYANLPKETRPVIFFAGDGVSDASAAGESDILFVKIRPDKGNDLMKHCKMNKIPFVPFNNFGEVKAKMQAIAEGKQTLEAAVAEATSNLTREFASVD